MTEPQKLSRLSVQDYLAFEQAAHVRHEYVDGRIFAMTGGSKAHNIISLNIAMIIRAGLRDRGCAVYMSDVKVRVVALNSFYYPDVVIDCGAFDQASVYTDTPASIFEVLSKSTASTDRREKLIAYQNIPSLKEYVIVHQTRKRLEVYRNDESNWTVEEIGSDGMLIIEACPHHQITLSTDEIYAGIEFDERPDLQVREDVEVYSW
jgi:Uncharacterized protein conserved in cyanobacteria